MNKPYWYHSIFCLMLLLFGALLWIANAENSYTHSDRHLFIQITPSNTIRAAVTLQTNMPNTRWKGVSMSTNMLLRYFYNEKAFGERWILEGWFTDNSKRVVLFNSQEWFKAKARRLKQLRDEAERIGIEKLKKQLKSTNKQVRAHASDLLFSRWIVGGGSRRAIERARDVCREKAGPLVYEIPVTVDALKTKNDESLRYLQLRIVPLESKDKDKDNLISRQVGTNDLDTLTSNIIDLHGIGN